MNSERQTEVSKKLTQGELFKKKHGISKTQYRILRRRGLLTSSVPIASDIHEAKEQNKEFKKKWKNSLKLQKKAKADKAKAGRKVKTKK